MKLLLDENMPLDFRYYLPEHEVRTVDYMAWKGKGNGELIALASDDFDALITLDQKIPYQQHLTEMDVAVIVMIADSDNIEALKPLAPQILDALNTIRPGDIVRIEASQKE
jgi:hypothetical protein